MNFFQRHRIFQKIVTCITLTFFGLLVLTVLVAFSRSSGSTGLDMSKIQKMRAEAKAL